jgi:selenium metabolism protein YedF
MSNETVDARGKLCPVPLVMTKKIYDSLSEGEQMQTLVDNPTSARNVQAFILESGGVVTSTTDGQVVTLSITKGAKSQSGKAEDYCSTGIEPAIPHIICVTRDSMGNGEPRELGKALMQAFLRTIKDVDNLPSHIIFIHNGVNLLKNGTKTVEAVQELEALGVTVLACGTCLDYFGLMDGIGCGKVSNMYDILSVMTHASKVIQP